MRVRLIAVVPFALAVSALAQQPSKPDTVGAKAPATAPAAAPAQTLGVGDPAPALVPEHWIKGQPIGGFETGKTYVIEFWATWCGPCIAAMPHLTELQKKHADVTFVGVAASERRPKEGEADERLPFVKGFVRGKGEIMGYRVAYTPERDIPTRWMTAAGQNGIPCSFVVGPSGLIEWIGHPTQLDEPLAKIVAGTWDRTVEVERSKAARALREKQAAFAKSLAQAQADKDWDAVTRLYRERMAEEPDNTMIPVMLYQVLAGRAERPGEASKLGNELLERFKEDPELLNQIAWFTVDDRSVKTRDLDLALRAAERANTLEKGQNPAILDTLARVLWEKGDKSKALELQKMAIGKLPAGDESPMAKQMREALEKYQSGSR